MCCMGPLGPKRYDGADIRRCLVCLSRNCFQRHIPYGTSMYNSVCLKDKLDKNHTKTMESEINSLFEEKTGVSTDEADKDVISESVFLGLDVQFSL